MERHMIGSRLRVGMASGDDISALRELISQSYLFLCRRYYTPKQIECALAHHVGIDKQMIDEGPITSPKSMAKLSVVGGGVNANSYSVGIR